MKMAVYYPAAGLGYSVNPTLNIMSYCFFEFNENSTIFSKELKSHHPPRVIQVSKKAVYYSDTPPQQCCLCALATAHGLCVELNLDWIQFI